VPATGKVRIPAGDCNRFSAAIKWLQFIRQVPNLRLQILILHSDCLSNLTGEADFSGRKVSLIRSSVGRFGQAGAIARAAEGSARIKC